MSEITETNFETEVLRMIETIQDATPEKLLAQKDLITKIASYCKQRRIYLDAEARLKALYGEETALNLYRTMLLKVANAPFKVYAHATVIIFLPFIAEKLSSVNGSKEN